MLEKYQQHKIRRLFENNTFSLIQLRFDFNIYHNFRTSNIYMLNFCFLSVANSKYTQFVKVLKIRSLTNSKITKSFFRLFERNC